MNTEEKLKILCENLNIFEKRGAIAKEERLITLSHIASLICTNENLSFEELTSLYCRLVNEPSGAEEILLYEQIQASPALFSRMKESLNVFEHSITPAGTHGKIACVKNPVNNRALEAFSQAISNLKPDYVSSFSEACERVSDESCEFCILPIENTIDGKMTGFYSMIDRYELKICLVVDIEDERYESVRYALLGRSCFEITEKAKNKDFIFEFSISDENGNFINRILSAANACNADIISINAYPVQYDNNLKRYLFSLNIAGNKISSMLGFLWTNHNNYTNIGFYQNIII